MGILKTILGFLLGPVMQAVRGAISDWRRDKALEKKGALEVSNRGMKESLDASVRQRNVMRLLSTDSDFRDSVRSRYTRSE